MSEPTNNAVLKVTRGMIYVLMVLVVIGGIALAIASVALPLNWDHVLVEIAKEKPGMNAEGLLPWILAVLAFAMAPLGAVWTILKKLLAIIGTVAEGDPFVRANAVRLKVIGWIMVAMQVIGIPFALVVTNVGDRIGEADMKGDFSITSVLAILLVFVLAGVFERGAAMREELEGTV